MNRKAPQQRGNAAVVAALALAVSAAIVVITGKDDDFAARREAKTDAALREAERALFNYYLIENVRLGAEKIQTEAKTRALQLPCPDNVEREKPILDGLQEASCGGGDKNETGESLKAGSRFGRLPWRTGTSDLSGVRYAPGIDKPHLRDGYNARFWYALAYNVAPKSKDRDNALNLHALAAQKDGWLMVRDAAATIIADRVMAVILAPHEPLDEQTRFDEDILAILPLFTTTINGGITTTISINGLTMTIGDAETITITIPPSGVAATVAENHFEELVFISSISLTIHDGDTITIKPPGATITLSNRDDDGDFVYAPLRTTATLAPLSPGGATLSLSLSVMDDRVAYLTMDEMLNPEGDFLPHLETFLGANRKIQNLPLADSPLAAIASGLRNFRAAYGFYPIPAAINENNWNALARGCGLNELAQDATVTIGNNAQLINLRPFTNHTGITGDITVTLSVAAPMTATDELAVIGDVLVENIGQTTITLSPTLASGARVILPSGATLLVSATSAISILAGTTVTLTSAAPVIASISAAVYATVEHRSGVTLAEVKGYPQLAALTAAHGLLSEHNARPMTAAHQGNYRTFAAGAEGRFLSPAELSLTDGTTITIMPRDRITFPPGARMRISQGRPLTVSSGVTLSSVEISTYLSHAVFPSGAIAETAITTTTIGGAQPSRDTFLRRDLAIIVNKADMSVGATMFIPAPAVIYPWRRQQGGLEIDRDSVNRWPPCWDAREFAPEVKRLSENFPMYYAVAGDCLPGGDCGGGLTITISPGATFALPAPHTISLTATFLPPFALITSTASVATPYADASLRVAGTNFIHYGTGGIVNSLPSGETLFIPRGAAVSLHSPLAAVGTLASPMTITVGQLAVLPPQTPLRSELEIQIESAEALLIFSPAPLQKQVSCTTSGGAVKDISQTRAYAAADCTNLSALDFYLENDENRRLDSVFVMEQFQARASLTATVSGGWREPVNDFFIIFGGRLAAP